jgi:DNA repair exonuclease SbcCD nuclease subunit
MRFAHLGDCHLGSWRQPELKELNLQSFQEAIMKIIAYKLVFVLIAGDLFDSAYPPVETLKEAFNEFRKLKEAGIPVFLIAGSHDYSVSGKTFLDVLEKAAFCKNVSIFEERQDKIFLIPTLYKNVAIYGYPGKKSGLEVEEIQRIKLQDSPGLFKVLMLHTTIHDAISNILIKSVDEKSLPKADYYALGHLHINYQKGNLVYSGPTFPNNIPELEELEHGSFFIYDNGVIKQEKIRLKEVVPVKIETKNSIGLADKIIQKLDEQNIRGKVVIVKVSGILEHGKISDIDFPKVESYLKSRNAFVFLKSTSKLHMAESEIKLSFHDSEDLESQILKQFEQKNPSRFNQHIPDLLRALQIEKLEDETTSTFEDRLFSETKRILSLK